MNRLKNKYFIVSLISIFIVTIVGTIAWYRYSTNKSSLVLILGDSDELQVTLSPYQLNIVTDPVLTYENEDYVTVKSTNNKDETDYFSLYYNIENIDTELKSTAMKYVITKSSNNVSYSEYTSGNFSEADNNTTLTILEERIPADTTYYYKVYIYLDGSEGDQSLLQGKSLVANISSNIDTIKFDSLYDNIKRYSVMDNISSTYVSSDTGIDFTTTASDTNGKGVYTISSTANDTYPISYYRGAVDNNNVIFGGFCWKIVRTTDTGGIKMIYNGVPSNGQCNNTGTDSQIGTSAFNTNDTSLADLGYKYGTRYTGNNVSYVSTYYYGKSVSYSTSTGKYTLSTTGTGYTTSRHYTCASASATTCTTVKYVYYVSGGNIYYINLKISDAIDEMLTSSTDSNPSTILSYIDTWYENNMTSYSDYLEDSTWCNDRSYSTERYQASGWYPTGGSMSTYLYFNAYNRRQDKTPTFECPSNDSYNVSNGKLTYKIGLLTGDEALYVGAFGSNTTNYLYTGENVWLTGASNIHNYAYVSAMKPDGTIDGKKVSNTYGVRPAISLKNDTIISGGNGSVNNPYKVFVDENYLYYKVKENAVMDNISSTYVTSSTGIDFTQISSDNNGKGIYTLSSTASNTYPVYYYRGAVTDNNVIFGGFCWKIVRTTDTGGVKLIYNGSPSHGECNNTGTDSQIGTSEFNTSSNSPAYVGYKYGTVYTRSSARNDSTWLYGSDVTYSGGEYTLTDATSNGLSSTKHYTCKTTGSTCSSVYYVYYLDISTIYYITLSSGKTVENALDEMLGSNSYTTDSTIKTVIDTWYTSNLSTYADYLEDTVWCSDKSYSSWRLNASGWNPNGGGLTTYLIFSPIDRLHGGTPSVDCNTNDSYTVANGKLTNKIGLITSDEVMLAGGQTSSNSSYYLYIGQNYWTMSPYDYLQYSAGDFRVLPGDYLGNAVVYFNAGVRPSISLAYGAVVTGGDGTATTPYIVE